MTESIKLNAVTKKYGSQLVLNNINLDVNPGEFVSLVGPSGCGKSTLLRVIAGLTSIDKGEVFIGNRQVNEVPPKERNIAMVFQNYALYPHMTVAENISTPLLMSRLGLLQRQPYVGALLGAFSRKRKDILTKIHTEVINLCDSLQISKLVLRKPGQLSGGQRQRVALARAMVRHPDAFLMDEPLSNLDAKLRIQVRDELADLHQRLGSTFLYVTHDQTEALTLSNRVAVMDQGQILQIGTPSELYETPSNLTVAKFIGTPSMNILPLEMGNAHGLNFSLITAGQVDQSQAVIKNIGIRPEHLMMGSSGYALPAEIDMQLEAAVHRTEHHGSEWIYILKLAQWQDALITARVSTQKMSKPLAQGTDVLVGWRLADLHLFDATGSRVQACPHLIK
ncbi:ABC transporter ATP-binding protein [Limnohabitans sp. Rim8]|jgi:multiple sugar transport system ATP-binding protein|uniref:ABC transporter ATP-binding protein n=1 Tax=Limnohabitans sp. Rim8 TaxID=1100718 RepID=UPI0025E524DC|nr:ABC transporter ATP-binding protein [Limnohabitans sp. Rim8]